MSIQKAALTVLGSLVAASGVLFGLLLLPSGVAAAPSRLPLCVTSGSVPDLSDAQAQNARTIYATALVRGGRPAAYVALMTGLTESNLLVLSNPNDPSGNRIPAQGIGYDHDSLGIFQQRPGWGTAAQRMDPVSSTNLFLDALLALPSWESMQPWRAAQSVQRSAFTGNPTPANGQSSVYGGNYLRQAERAGRVLAAIGEAYPSSGPLDCGGAVISDNSPGTSDLTPLSAAGVSPRAAAAVAFALAQRGKAYQWGGEGPDTYDCSGLMQTAWRHAGVSIGRVTTQQFRNGTATTATALRPGDLVLIPGTLGTLAHPGHIGMYIGNGQVLHAPRTGDVVKVVRLSSFIADGVSGYRHIA
ncbi:C40 family peptidase [Terrabacter sp. GCM10028922]|uniref:C40 family peptidase n=1 Tax=Terrabacter sp. GCM10028922 TaxID=3273428 RepID=UPI0036150F43